jgi:hypothetical protein
MPESFRLVWAQIALRGPLTLDEVHEFAIAGVRDALLDAGIIEYIADGSIQAVPELLNKYPAATWNMLSGAENNVDNHVDKSGNPVDNHVDKSIFPDVYKSSSSNVVEISKNGENDERTPLKNPAKKSRGRPRGKQPTDDAEFDAFWSAYPKDVGKKSAIDVWNRIRSASKDWPALYSDIMAGLAMAKASRQWTVENGQYVPEAHRWLSKERWRDRLPPAILGTNIDTWFYDVPQSPREAPSNDTGDTRLMRHTRPDNSSQVTTATNQTDVLFPGLSATPEYVELALTRIKLEIDDRMAPDGILVDLADVELIRMAPESFKLKTDPERDFLQRLFREHRLNWRTGRRPTNGDEWQLELALRENEQTALYEQYLRDEGESA